MWPENAERARVVAEYFRRKYAKPSTDREFSWQWQGWAVEVLAPCANRAQAESLIDLATRDGAVHGWIRIEVDLRAARKWSGTRTLELFN
jgi:hypothetical protein